MLAAPAAMGVSGPTLALSDAATGLAVSPGTAAWLLTAYGIGMAVGTPLLTAAGGRRGAAGTVRAGAAVLVLGAALALVAPNLPLAVAGRALEAAGAAGLNVAAFQIAGRDRSGRAPGLVAIGSAVGGTSGLFIGAAVAGTLGWRATLVLPLLSLLALVPALRLAARTAPEPEPPRTAAARSLPLPLDVLRDPGFRTAAGLMLALSTVNFALLYAAPRRVATLTGWNGMETGAAASIATLVGALLSWQLIRAAPALGMRRMRLLLATGSLTAAALASFAPWSAVVLIGSATSSLVTAGGQGLLTGAATGRLPEARHGTAIGLFNLAFLIGVAAGPAVAEALTAA
ncbi:major facilitator superfamily protein [Streptomyces venezuelae]|uniref:MFS transporter n=1 Tax=Streptomyces gardneri TaxID=66892 RepID=UPI0006E44DAD|nr:MFS transporter [Streptomyces gardneri]ALO10109.1 major facilitator superfamily protein [Streptomyces venezuelae]QPK47142.1 MFS transporter [Streptomyces gardneri]WRK38561.1 MFS transporter [Streptomyces venezuelae]